MTISSRKSLFAILALLVLGILIGYFGPRLLAVRPSVVTTLPQATILVGTSSLPVSTPEPVAPKPRLLAKNEVLRVAWQKPAYIVTPPIFKGEGEHDSASDFQAYKVGSVTAGTYAKADVLLLLGPSGELGYATYHVLRYGDAFILIDQSSQYLEYSLFDLTKILVAPEMVLAGLDFPETFTYQGNRFNLTPDPWGRATLFDLASLKLVFTDPTLGPVYTDAVPKADRSTRNGFYLEAPDGTMRSYAFVPNFYDPDRHVPAVTWTGNQPGLNTFEYTLTDIGGCGSSNLASVATTLGDEDLVAKGVTSTEEPVYELKDWNAPLLQQIYANEYAAYQTPKLSFSEFREAHPVFFWRDPFGRLIKFQRMDFLPAVECGKPVIYLYPPRTTEVSVKLYPQGGFTKTEPAYHEGWQVVAEPSGQLTEVSSGERYPYLFWEGRGGLYETPDRGFVVSQSEVHHFLVEKLTTLGLNQKERTDFIEFWEPRMQGSPYYFVTFLGTAEMNRLAPLTIEPKPDTIIRVLMDFKPLAEKITVPPLLLRTPERQGFTVLEWGGVLH